MTIWRGLRGEMRGEEAYLLCSEQEEIFIIAHHKMAL